MMDLSDSGRQRVDPDQRAAIAACERILDQGGKAVSYHYHSNRVHSEAAMQTVYAAFVPSVAKTLHLPSVDCACNFHALLQARLGELHYAGLGRIAERILRIDRSFLEHPGAASTGICHIADAVVLEWCAPKAERTRDPNPIRAKRAAQYLFSSLLPDVGDPAREQRCFVEFTSDEAARDACVGYVERCVRELVFHGAPPDKRWYGLEELVFDSKIIASLFALAQHAWVELGSHSMKERGFPAGLVIGRGRGAQTILRDLEKIGLRDAAALLFNLDDRGHRIPIAPHPGPSVETMQRWAAEGRALVPQFQLGAPDSLPVRLSIVLPALPLRRDFAPARVVDRESAHTETDEATAPTGEIEDLSLPAVSPRLNSQRLPNRDELLDLLVNAAKADWVELSLEDGRTLTGAITINYLASPPTVRLINVDDEFSYDCLIDQIVDVKI